MPLRYGFTAYGADERGRPVVHRPSMAGEVRASFPWRCAGSTCHPDVGKKPHGQNGCTVEVRHTICSARCDCPYPEDNGFSQAEEWAQVVFERDPVVNHVVITPVEQDYGPWRYSKGGRHAVIHRPA